MQHLCKILEKEVKFDYDGDYIRVFNYIKEKLMLAPNIVALNYALLFELIYDVSGLALGGS